MCQFIETIRVNRGEIARLAYHLQRVRATRQYFWKSDTPLGVSDLKSVIDPAVECGKLRFTYDAHHIYDLTFTPYIIRRIKKLRLVPCDEAHYPYKSTDRTQLNRLKAMVAPDEEVIIVKNNHITDTSYTNVALYDGSVWATPSTPLLHGTQRAALIEKGLIVEREIRVTDLPKYKKIALINAMMDLGDCVLDNFVYP